MIKIVNIQYMQLSIKLFGELFNRLDRSFFYYLPEITGKTNFPDPRSKNFARGTQMTGHVR